MCLQPGGGAMTSTLEAPAMDVRPVDLRTAASIEAAEARAWADAYAAAPADWAEQAGLSTRWIGGTLMLSWAATERRYFSRAVGLGVAEPATEAAIDEILDGYERSGITMFLLQSLPHCRPAKYEHWLQDRGLERFDQQDRIVRDAGPVARPADAAIERGLVVERVTRETADEWAQFLSS